MISREELLEILNDDDLSQLIDKKNAGIFASLQVQDVDKNNLLHIAAKNGYQAIVDYLIEHDVPYQKNSNGETPLDFAQKLEESDLKENIVFVLTAYQEKMAVRSKLSSEQEVKKNEIKMPGSEIDDFKNISAIEGFAVVDDLLSPDLPSDLIKKIEMLPNKPWLDIPQSKEIKLDKDKEIFKNVLDLMNYYHELLKTDKNTLKRRIELLDKINLELDNLQSKNFSALSAAEAKEIGELKRSAFGKLIYLKKIASRELDNNWFAQFMFGNPSDNKQILRTVRYEWYGHELNLSFEDKKNDLGNSTPYLDPCMRVGIRSNIVFNEKNLQIFNQLYDQWLSEMKEANLTHFPSFYLWLEDKDKLTSQFAPTNRQGIELLDLRACSIQAGQFILTALGKSISVDADFTFTKEGHIFISKQNSWTSIPNHPNIHFGFEPVQFAGQIKVVDGKVVEISNESGHYTPGPVHFKQFLDFLKEKNCLDEKCQVKIRHTNAIGKSELAEGLYNTINFPDIIKKHCHKIIVRGKDGHNTYQFLTTSQIIDNLRNERTLKAVHKAAKKMLKREGGLKTTDTKKSLDAEYPSEYKKRSSNVGIGLFDSTQSAHNTNTEPDGKSAEPGKVHGGSGLTGSS